MYAAFVIVVLPFGVIKNNKLCGIEAAIKIYAPAPCKSTFDLLTLKVVSESYVTWATSVPILVFLGLSVLDLGPMYATDRQTDVKSQDRHGRRASSLNAPTLGAGHNNNTQRRSRGVRCVGVGSDRLAIQSHGEINVMLSAQHLLSCIGRRHHALNGCHPNGIDRAWWFIRRIGSVNIAAFVYAVYKQLCSTRTMW